MMTGSLLAYRAIRVRHTARVMVQRDCPERDIGERDTRERNIGERDISETIVTCKFAE